MSEERETPAPRPFVVGDRVRHFQNATWTGWVVKGDAPDGFTLVGWDDIPDEKCQMLTKYLEHAAPAPAPEATAAPDGTLKMPTVPESWLDDARKVSDEWKARAEKAEARVTELEATIEAIWSILPAELSRGGHIEARIRQHIAALTERAEKAELTVRSRDEEINGLRFFLKQFEDGGMSGTEVRAARDDERARFERNTASRMLGGLWASEWNGDTTAAIAAIVRISKELAGHYFPAKEQGK